ncbi:MAG: twin-arginine translocation signal domain-containing protein, partial [Candidatus Nanohaloarchaea archaeon]
MEDQIKDIVEDEEKAEKLSQLIEQKIEEKVEKVTGQKTREKQEKKQEEKELTRRGFLKKLGAGTLGLGAMSLLPSVSAYDIKSSDGLQVWSDGDELIDASSAPVEILDSNFRLPTGNAIEDGDGDSRIEIEDIGTILTESDDSHSFRAYSSNADRPRAEIEVEDRFELNDLNGGFAAVEYTTASDAPGTLELANSYLSHKASETLSDGDLGKVAQHIQATDASSDENEVQTVWFRPTGNASNGNYVGRIHFSSHHSDSYNHYGSGIRGLRDGGDARRGGLEFYNSDVDNARQTTMRLTSGYNVEIPNGDLQLDTGQAIEDGDGTTRYSLQEDRTEIRDTAGDRAFAALGDGRRGLYAKSGDELYIYDDVGAYRAVEYQTSSDAPGTLELTNAELDMGSQ